MIWFTIMSTNECEISKTSRGPARPPQVDCRSLHSDRRNISRQRARLGEMMADRPVGSPHSRVFLVVGIVVVLAAASLVIYLQTGNQPGTTSSPPVGTTTTTVYFPCPVSVTAQTSTTTTSSPGNSASNKGLDLGPLLGNFSAMTVVMYGNDSNGKSFTSSSMAVLNRSSTPSGPIYEVNVTSKSIEPQVTTYETQNATTTITSPGNVTSIGSVVADVARNGSVFSMIRSTGNLSSTPLPLALFTPLILLNYSSSGGRTVSTSTITIGTTKMSVANWEPPTLVEVIVQDGCNGEPATTATATISHSEIQFGQVPGTSFTLVTRFSEVLSMQSNSTAFSPSRLSLTEEVTGFTVA